MSLTLMYITNSLPIALIAEKYGVKRIWIDLEILDKEKRQKNLDTVKSHHTISDISKIAPFLTTSEMLVRVNHWHSNSKEEIDAVIESGADMVMLPYWKTSEEVKCFIEAVRGRCKTTLLLETREARECLDEVLTLAGIDEIHIGLNDLHLSYGMSFMFELLADGTVEEICNKIAKKGLPYGFGGIARLGSGALPAEYIIKEHYRLGSTRAILSRSFCNTDQYSDLKEIDTLFSTEMRRLRTFEKSLQNLSKKEFEVNREQVNKIVADIIHKKEEMS